MLVITAVPDSEHTQSLGRIVPELSRVLGTMIVGTETQEYPAFLLMIVEIFEQMKATFTAHTVVFHSKRIRVTITDMLIDCLTINKCDLTNRTDVLGQSVCQPP